MLFVVFFTLSTCAGKEVGEFIADPGRVQMPKTQGGLLTCREQALLLLLMISAFFICKLSVLSEEVYSN